MTRFNQLKLQSLLENTASNGIILIDGNIASYQQLFNIISNTIELSTKKKSYSFSDVEFSNAIVGIDGTIKISDTNKDPHTLELYAKIIPDIFTECS